MKKIITALCTICILSVLSWAEGADAAYPVLEPVFQKLPLQENTCTILTDTQLKSLLDAAAEQQLNLFELLDCFYRYLSARSLRIEISGDSLRLLQEDFDFGGHPITLLLPIDKIIKMQTGAAFTSDEKALDIYLDSAYSAYIDIATAMYEPRCGFEKIEPLVFSQAYGMRIKKWGIKKYLDRIHLYEPRKAAVYAKKFYKPKRWGLGAVQRLNAAPPAEQQE
ncbi:MAG: hypothetical protein ACTTH8_02945 [Treponema sp.]